MDFFLGVQLHFTIDLYFSVREFQYTVHDFLIVESVLHNHSYTVQPEDDQ